MTISKTDTKRQYHSLDDLADAKRWVAWREEEQINKDGSTVCKKVPYDPHTGRKASTDNPTTWGTRDEAERRWQLMQKQQQCVGGIGIVLGDLGDGTYLMGSDLDGCFRASGHLTDWASEVVERFNSYAEVSPSGEGVKNFFLVDSADIDAIGELMGGKTRRAFPKGEHQEIALDRARYYTVTEDYLDDEMMPLRMVPTDDVRWLLEEAGPEFKGTNNHSTAASRDESGSGHGYRFLRDCKWQGFSQEEAFAAIQEDPGPAGEWARRKNERDLKMAWEKVARYVPTHSWDDPDISLLDDRRGNLPSFPLDTIRPDWLQERIKRAAHGAGTTVDHVAVPLLGISSGLIGSARKVRASPAFSQPMTCWTGTVGYSGGGKTPGQNASKEPLDELERQQEHRIAEARRQHEVDLETAKLANEAWKAEYKKALMDNHPPPEKPESAYDPPPFIEPRLYVTDTTIEKMAILLQARPTGMLLIMDELAGWFKNMHRYSGGDDRQFWLTAWDGKRYPVERVNKTITVENLLVGVVGGMQPDTFAECFKGAADGMYARFLWSWPSKAPYRPLTDDAEEADPCIIEMFKKLAQIPTPEGWRQRDIPLSAKARAAFEKTRQHVEAHIETKMGKECEWWAKVPAHILRLAGVLALLNWALGENKALPKEILAQYVEAAHRLVVVYFWPHAQACLRQIGFSDRDADARLVLRYIRSASLNEFNLECIRCDALSRRLNAKETGALLGQLCEAGWLKRKPRKTSAKGRPPNLYEVNPKLTKST